MKTVFGHVLLGWEQFTDHQLLRCPVQKNFEAELLLTVPAGSSFLDVGAHYGDTVLTMALFARNHQRSDIRFFAFEPNVEKCQHLRRISELNQLSVQVFEVAVGDRARRLSRSSQFAAESGQCTYTENAGAAGDIDMVSLDELAATVRPVGFLHIDTEGWDARCLQGAQQILRTDKPYVIAELWSPDTAQRNGFSRLMEQDIAKAMRPHPELVRQKNMVDEETNVVYYPAQQLAKLRQLRQLIQ